MTFDWKERPCLVTGGAGFIGSHLVDALITRGAKVRVLDSLVVGRRDNLRQHMDNPDFDFIEADISDAAAVEQAMMGMDTVFHLAARADIVPSIEVPDDYYRANVDGSFNVMQAARTCEIRKVLYASSSSCYGFAKEVPTSESCPTDPQYPYALTKYLGEQILLHWSSLYNIPAVALCLFNVYGPRARTSGTYGAVFGVFLAQLLAGKPLTIVGDGTQTRDFTFVSDVVDAFIAAAERDVSGMRLNVGTGAPVSVNRLVELLSPESVAHIPKRPGEPDTTHADARQAQTLLDWAPKVSFEEGVAIMKDNLDYWRDAPVWTVDKIDAATKTWFDYLGTDK